MTDLTRRHFIRRSAQGLGTLAVGTGLAGCTDEGSVPAGGQAGTPPLPGPDVVPDLEADPETDGARVRFDHGVASGDPQSDALIIWTRATPTEPGPLVVRWEVAGEPDFSSPSHTGETLTDASRDWTVKVDVRGLAAGTLHHYRFVSGEASSPVGRARTLPVGAVDAVRLAVLSCANYPAGYFHVYRQIAEAETVDAVVHLGDYLYEEGMGGFATEDAESLGRALEPGNDAEAITLADYRARYATYRRDPDLQAAHASAPFIAVLDDHEIANNVWRDGAAAHDVTEGDFDTRVAAAIQAWFEWMPVRPQGGLPTAATAGRWYRRFEFGDLVSLCMLDARLGGRDRAVDRNDYIDGSSRTLNMVEYEAALGDPNRTMLGDEQSAWLENQLASSSARWQVLGQQVLMARADVPAELRIDTTRRGSVANLTELVDILARLDAGSVDLTDEERARIETRVPYYQDGWDGYPLARERLLDAARAADCNLVVLAGDTHNAWASDLTAADGTVVGVEFATTAVSSPGLSRLFGVEAPAEAAIVESALERLIDDVVYVNVLERGYLVVEFDEREARANWRFVTTVKSRRYSPANRGRTLSVLPGPGNRRLLG